ncbi:MAG: chemotaxis protein CheB [Bacillota bacterium]
MKYQAIVIGTSTRGMAAPKEILAPLPVGFPMPILIVQHLRPHVDSYLAKYLDDLSRIKVKEADEKEEAAAGHSYVSPSNYHMLIEEGGYISFSVDEYVKFARPSVDVLFETAADVYKDCLIGIILTVANGDGSKGLRRIKQKGGIAIVEDLSTAEAGAMPQATIKAVQVDYILSLRQIPGKLIEIVGV